MKCMQGARHIGKIVFTNSPLAREPYGRTGPIW